MKQPRTHWEAIRAAYYNSGQLGIALLSHDAVILDCNPAFARILGRDIIGTIGLNVISDLTKHEDQPATRRRFKFLVEEAPGEVVSTRKCLLRPDGTEVAVSLEASAVQEDDGQRFVLDALWELPLPDSEVEDTIERLGHQIELLINTPRGVEVNVGDNINSGGGDVTGRDKTVNSQKLLIALVIVLGMVLMYMAYVIGTNGAGSAPEPPPSVGDQVEKISGL